MDQVEQIVRAKSFSHVILWENEINMPIAK